MRVTRIALVSCAAALATLTACADLFAPDGPEVNVSISRQLPAAGTLRFRASLAGRQVEVNTSSASAATTDWRAPRYGDVPTRVALLDARGDTLASAAFTHRLQRDHLHWISALVGTRRPLGFCIGLLSVTPISGAGTDTLFVMHGSIPKGAIC